MEMSFLTIKARIAEAPDPSDRRLAPRVPVVTHTVEYPLHHANDALDDVRHGRIEGAAVLVPSGPR